MNPEIREKWVAALRSGDYTQGTDVLRSQNDEYCCLGVLCDVATKEGLDLPITHNEGFSYVYGLVEGDDVWQRRGDYSDTELPRMVADWAELDNSNPQLGDYTAIERNDTLQQSFAEIADAIELYL